MSAFDSGSRQEWRGGSTQDTLDARAAIRATLDRQAAAIRASQQPAHTAGHPETGGQPALCCVWCLEED